MFIIGFIIRIVITNVVRVMVTDVVRVVGVVGAIERIVVAIGGSVEFHIVAFVVSAEHITHLAVFSLCHVWLVYLNLSYVIQYFCLDVQLLRLVLRMLLQIVVI